METYLSEFQPMLFSNDRAKALVFEAENENQLLSMLSKYISKSKMEEWKLEVQELFIAGMVVKHFKRATIPDRDDSKMYLYEIVGVSYHTETKEKMMTYKSLYKNNKGEYIMWSRPHDMFYSKVDKEKYPGYSQEYRMEPVGYQKVWKKDNS